MNEILYLDRGKTHIQDIVKVLNVSTTLVSSPERKVHQVSLKYTPALVSVCQSSLSSETALLIKAKFYVELPYEGGNKKLYK